MKAVLCCDNESSIRGLHPPSRFCQMDKETDKSFVSQKKAEKNDEQLYADWVEKFGEERAKVIKQTVEDNVADYEYLKKFAVKV